jgi:hypothetical protein
MTRLFTILVPALLLGAVAHAAPVPKATAAAAQKILAQKIPAYYGNGASKTNNFGVVSELGKAKLTATSNPSIVKAAVRFDGNDLWGGDYHYKVNVDVNTKTFRIKPLDRPVVTKTVN